MTETDALFSNDRRFRYWLTRVWDESLPMLCLIGVNPSLADETTDDPTIRREKAFAERDGFGGILKLNLYAYRTPFPADLWAAQKKDVDIIGGPLNYVECLQGYAEKHRCDTVVATWGRHGRKRGPDVLMRWPGMKCFGLNSDGTPKHTLYLKADTPLIDI